MLGIGKGTVMVDPARLTAIIIMQAALGTEEEDNCTTTRYVCGGPSGRKVECIRHWGSRSSTIIRPGWAVAILRHECTQSPAHPGGHMCVCGVGGPKELQDLPGRQRSSHF